MKMTSKRRDSNLELYRIILMILIVMHHYVVNSGLLQAAISDGMNVKSLGVLTFGAWGKIGINCFLLITGYYMCKSKITLKKFLRLLIEVEFYNILIYCIFVIFGYEKFSFGAIFRTIVPFYSVTTGFVGCFLLFYLAIPFINVLLRNLNKKKHMLFMALLIFIYTILGSIPKIAVGYNYVIWFSVVYVIGAFIRCYMDETKINRKLIWFGMMASIILSIVSIPICWLILKNPYYLVNDSNKILAVTTSVMMFLVFKNLKIKYHKWINIIASATFGVLLIHANSDAMRQWLWKDTFQNVTMYNSEFSFIHAVLAVLVVYVVCVGIDLLRAEAFEKYVYKYTDLKAERLENKAKNVL